MIPSLIIPKSIVNLKSKCHTIAYKLDNYIKNVC